MTYTYSYSGADCKAYAWFSEGRVTPLSSLATISISVHEAKAPVRRLGYVGVSGYSKGIRTIAGTMVCLIIEDHPLSNLMMLDINNGRNYYYSKDEKRGGNSGGFEGIKGNKLGTMISPFNLKLIYKSETDYDSSRMSSLLLKHIEITGESIVTSVNDMVTEVVFQFVANDISTFNTEYNDIPVEDSISNMSEDLSDLIIREEKERDIQKQEIRLAEIDRILGLENLKENFGDEFAFKYGRGYSEPGFGPSSLLFDYKTSTEGPTSSLTGPEMSKFIESEKRRKQNRRVIKESFENRKKLAEYYRWLEMQEYEEELRAYKEKEELLDLQYKEHEELFRQYLEAESVLESIRKQKQEEDREQLKEFLIFQEKANDYAKQREQEKEKREKERRELEGYVDILRKQKKGKTLPSELDRTQDFIRRYYKK